MKIKHRLAFALTLTAMVLATASAGTVFAADDAIPGGILYPLDRALESLHRSYIKDPKIKADFELSILNERIVETSKTKRLDKANMQEIRSQKEITSDAVAALEDTQKETAERVLNDQLKLELDTLQSLPLEVEDSELKGEIDTQIETLKVQIASSEIISTEDVVQEFTTPEVDEAELKSTDAPTVSPTVTPTSSPTASVETTEEPTPTTTP